MAHYRLKKKKWIKMPEFKNLRKKVRRRRIETMLLAGYAVAITCALFISLLHKTAAPRENAVEVAENYDFGNDVLTPSFVESNENNPFEQAYAQILQLKLVSDSPQITQKFADASAGEKEVVPLPTPKPKKQPAYGSFEGIYQRERHVVVVQPGDTFIALLNRFGMESKSATEAYNALRKVYDARNLKVGQYFILIGTFNMPSHELETLDTLILEPERGTKYILRTNEYDKFVAKVEQEKFARDVRVVKAKITGPVLTSMANAGVPNRYRIEISNIFSHMLNFSRNLKKGDTFEVKYEVSKDSFGDVVKNGNLLYAGFFSGNKSYKQYRYKNQFYDDKGQTKKTGLDKKPLAARNARISSLFGYRRHPILKTQKFHSGVDYAAPRGTAIFASGNGRVTMARYVNGYGNFVKIRHNAEYETAYGHMQRFAAGIRPGVSVRKGQVIGYVGSTGRSTGPHLHFEILRRGQRINPLKAAVATGNDLGGAQLAEFKRVMRQIEGMQEVISKTERKPLTTVMKEEPKEPASVHMTLAQNIDLIREAQKDLPEHLKSIPSETPTDSAEKSEDNAVPADKTATEKANATPAEGAAPAESTAPVESAAPTESAATQDNNAAAETVQSTTKRKEIYPPEVSALEMRNRRTLAKRKVIIPAKRPVRRSAKR